MAAIARVPITNVYMDGDYTARIYVGAAQLPMNVILDTGSSALALDGRKYQPDLARGDKTTTLAQADSYGDGSTWTGADITTSIGIGSGAHMVAARGVTAAVTYQQSDSMFRAADGILGLAYAPLDQAFDIGTDSWAARLPGEQVQQAAPAQVVPYLTRLAGEGVAADKVAFYTLRSYVHAGANGVHDALNKGWMVLGGGEECTDLYTGKFETVQVLADDWYNTNLKAVIVGDAAPISVRARGALGMPSNSIVDSGTNSLNLGPGLLSAILARFSPAQRDLLAHSIDGNLISMAGFDLAAWPTMTFVLQGDGGDVRLHVAPRDYWQVNTREPGLAMAAITPGDDGLAILGLPLMNGYFTVFDGAADGGRGAIRVAPSIRPS